MPGAEGTLIVTGPGSSWNLSGPQGALEVGSRGTGTLTIEDGGNVSNRRAVIGFASDSTGTVTVTGTGSTWTNTSLAVGSSGTGTLTIEDGGNVSNTTTLTTRIGLDSASTGTATVTGAGSTLR